MTRTRTDTLLLCGVPALSPLNSATTSALLTLEYFPSMWGPILGNSFAASCGPLSGPPSAANGETLVCAFTHILKQEIPYGIFVLVVRGLIGCEIHQINDRTKRINCLLYNVLRLLKLSVCILLQVRFQDLQQKFFLSLLYFQSAYGTSFARAVFSPRQSE